MNIVCVGLNHQTAPVDLRERVAVAEGMLGETARGLAALPGVTEAVVLSTCNRVEVYAATEGGAGAAGRVVLEAMAGNRLGSGAEGHFYERSGVEAARHLFAVASGLDSMVLGETEIFGQVKKAYAAAYEAGATGRVLNRLFQRSFSVSASGCASNTMIQRGATSVGSVAVELAERIFGELEDCAVMLLGAGEMSRVTAQSLLSRGARSIFVSNRSYERAVELAGEMSGEAIRFDDWPSKVAEVDIVIASTSAPHFVVTREQVVAARRQRRSRPLFLIDIAVPRDIEPAVNELDDIYLYDIDALQVLADEGRRQREEQIALCHGIIDEELARDARQAGRVRGVRNSRCRQPAMRAVSLTVQNPFSMKPFHFRIGTRGSELALAQAGLFEAAVRAAFPGAENEAGGHQDDRRQAAGRAAGGVVGGGGHAGGQGDIHEGTGNRAGGGAD